MYECIVVGTDGSKRAHDAVRAAGELATLAGATKLHVVTACEEYSSVELARLQDQLPEEYHDLVITHLDAANRLSSAKAIVGSAIEVVPHEMSGNPADCILAVAESVHADLIVVGARGIGAVERFVRGSVSTKVAHHSVCDVLIVEHDN